MERALRGKEIQRKEKNIDIADLSDPNRPTKLGERYGDLYENEWKDAYETLSSRFHDNEKEVVTKLRDIFKFVFQYCCNLCREQEKDLQRAMMAQHSKVNESIPYFVLNQFKDNRKACSEDFLKSHFRTFQTKYQSSPFYERGIDSFVKESFEISWLMNIQDPPIEIDTKTDRHDRFDGTAYKVFTVSGTTIDFVVWSTARLHQGGPILFKGVAQCIPGPTALDILKTGSDEINTTQGRTKQNMFGFNSTGDFQAVKEKDEEIKKLKMELIKKDKTIEQMRQMQGNDTGTMKKLLNDKEEELKQIKEELHKKKTQFEQMKYYESQQASELYRLKQDIAKKEEANKSYRMQNEQLKEEKDSLLLRLSFQSGAKLTYANPNLADLSDEYRPTKLAEMYAELYYNDWSEVFEYLNKNMGYDEQNCTKKLLNILQICYDDCRRRADKDLEDLLRLATDNFCKGDALPVEMEKTLKDNRKKYHSEIPKDLCQEIDKHLEPSLRYSKSDALAPYVSKCRSICWLMAIQNPPVAIERPENLKPGRKFDKNFYRYYTSSGDHIDFFVWPTLYILDGGPVLCKGVAQGDKGSAKSHGIETSGPQNSATSPGPQDLLTSSKKQGSAASPEPHDLATSRQQGPATPYKELDSKAFPTPQNVATSKPQSSAASPRKPDMPLSQHIDYTTPKPSKGDPTQGTRHQSQQNMMKSIPNNVKCGRPVGPAPTVNSTGSVAAKQYSSAINVKL